MKHHMNDYLLTKSCLQLISSVDPTALKLTKMDDEIYGEFRKDFPDLKMDIIKEDELKSAEAKEASIIYTI